MRSVTYTAEKGANIGRFGVIDKGQRINVTEHEFLGIKEDPRFKLNPEKHSPEVLVAAKVSQPYGTHGFDLRTVPWSKPNLFRIMEARFSKCRLLKIIAAMNEVGAPVTPLSEHAHRTTLVDSIIESAILCGWTILANDEIARLPIFYDVQAKPKPKAQAKPAIKPEEQSTPAATAVRKRQRRTTKTTT